MYIQAIWRNSGSQTSIGSLVEVDQWSTAGEKLQYMYEGYELSTMQLINANVDKGDLNGPCYLTRIETGEGSYTTQYIFALDLNTALEIAKKYGKVKSINETFLTFKKEGPI